MAIAAGLFAVPVLARAAIPPDEPAPDWVAPYLEIGRQSLIINNEGLGLAHYRFIGTRCGGDGVALLFERRSFPFLTATGAYVLTGRWPPADPGGFGGGSLDVESLLVEDFDQSLRDNWLPRQTWHACDPR